MSEPDSKPTWREASQPIDDEGLKEFTDFYSSRCEFNGINPPEIRTFTVSDVYNGFMPNMAIFYDPEDPIIYIQNELLDYARLHEKSKEVAALVLHETAHFLFKHKGQQGKSQEYITDRLAAALVGDKALYASAIVFLDDLVESSQNELLGSCSVLGGQAYESVKKHVDDTVKENLKIYGSQTERLANLKLDKPHPSPTKER